MIVAYGNGDLGAKAQFILANNYPDQNLSEDGLHWQWQTDLILGDDAALLQLFENDIKRDELRYGSDFGKLAENDSTQDSVYVLKREGYEKGQNTSDYPEYAKQAKDWEQQGDIALIKGDYVLRELHLKRYELKDHLGNVRVIIADVKDATLGLQGQPREFAAILKHYANYYPFGMEKPAMVYDKGGYRYGFNGKENDDDVKGVGNHQDYGMRVYDTRIAKFLSVDPLIKEYAFYSPYHFSGNTPIAAIDLDGCEPKSMIDANGKLTKPVIAFLTAAFNYNENHLQQTTWLDYPKNKGRWDDRISVPAALGYKGAHAITMDTEVFYSTSATKNYTDVQWIGLITHEQSHANEYHNQGELGFKVNYVKDAIFHKYTEIPTEQVAYRRQNMLKDYLAQGCTSNILNILNSKVLSEDDKIKEATKCGLKFRLDVVIPNYLKDIRNDTEMNKNVQQQMIRNYNNEIIEILSKI